jgi:GNAT superfamily N-acetyltransferase
MRYTIRLPGASTWAAFAELAERNNGVYGGCWCMAYHPEDSPTDAAQNHAGKERRVREGRAHAALVIDEDGSAQGWCQYGSPGELPGIKHKREYDKHPPPPPDWRITCLFVDKRHRGQGITRAALACALDQIAHLGGGLAEAISEVTACRHAQGRFLFSATAELFEQNGFTRVRQVGEHAWIVSKVIQPAKRNTRVPGDVSRGSKDSAGGNRLGRRPPLPPDQPVDPRVRDLAVHDAVFPQRPFTHEAELLQHAGRCHVARIGLSLDAI